LLQRDATRSSAIEWRNPEFQLGLDRSAIDEVAEHTRQHLVAVIVPRVHHPPFFLLPKAGMVGEDRERKKSLEER